MSTDVPDKARALLAAYQAGTLDDAGALRQLSALWSEDLGHSTIDHDRERRTGAAEVLPAPVSAGSWRQGAASTEVVRASGDSAACAVPTRNMPPMMW